MPTSCSGSTAALPCIEQAELVFEAKGIDRGRYRFGQGDIFRHAFAESFEWSCAWG